MLTIISSRAILAVVGLVPFICAIVGFGYALAIPVGDTWTITRGPALLYAIIGLLATVPAALIVLSLLRAKIPTGPQIEVLAAGLEVGDLALVQQLFPQSQHVWLTPLIGGYSGAAVLQARSEGQRGARQRLTIVKVGTAAKLQPEVENFNLHVREYVGNTATLLRWEQRGKRMALRWAYAAFSGEQVQTLADYAERGESLVPIISELFSSGSTLGLLFSTPRHDSDFKLYREYSWTYNEWQRLLNAATDVLGGAPLRNELPFASAPTPNPFALVARWFDPETGSGERVDQTFDVPIAIIHGDLNSRNVLIDKHRTVFVIDFARAGSGHLLRDFAQLEVELMLMLDEPADEAAVRKRVQQADELLHNSNGRPCTTLRDLFETRPVHDWRSEAIVTLRRQAHDLAGQWLKTPATSYFVALLHATLETVRFAQCSREKKRTALLIAARLCQLLE